MQIQGLSPSGGGGVQNEAAIRKQIEKLKQQRQELAEQTAQSGGGGGTGAAQGDSFSSEMQGLIAPQSAGGAEGQGKPMASAQVPAGGGQAAAPAGGGEDIQKRLQMIDMQIRNLESQLRSSQKRSAGGAAAPQKSEENNGAEETTTTTAETAPTSTFSHPLSRHVDLVA